MTPNKKAIRLTSIICAITFVLTFFVCLNISYQCFDIKWFSNTFQLTILGGIFASSVVVLLCEIQKYRMNKRVIEDTLWGNTSILYVKLMVAKHKLESILQSPNQPVSANLFDEYKTAIMSYLGQIHNTIDYAPYNKKNILRKTLIQFQRENTMQIMRRLQDYGVLNIAVNMSDIEIRKQNPLQSKVITAEIPFVAQAVQNLYDGINEILSIIEALLKSIDYSGRYECDKTIATITEKSQALEDINFEALLKHN